MIAVSPVAEEFKSVGVYWIYLLIMVSWESNNLGHRHKQIPSNLFRFPTTLSIMQVLVLESVLNQERLSYLCLFTFNYNKVNI